MNIIKKLSGLFPYADTVLHFIAGAVIALVFLWIFNDPYAGFAAAFIAGGFKEFSDNIKQKSVAVEYVIASYIDWAVTVTGALLVEFIWF